LGAGDYTYVTIIDSSNSGNFEIVKVTAISGTTFTIVRAQQNTIAKAFASGDKVDLRITAGLIEEAIGQTVTEVDTLDSVTGRGNTTTNNITVGDIVADQIQLTGGTGSQGTVSWNTDEETLDVIQNGAVLQVGQEVHYHVRNNTASQIDNGTPVMVTGTIGSSARLTVAPMDATDTANDMYYIGLATEDIAADSDGKVTHFGKVRGMDTSGYSEGAILWLSTTTVGAFTTTEPTAGIKIPAAIVINSHASVGTVFCRFQGSYGLHDLHDTQLVSNADNDVLAYDSASSSWKNQSASEAGLATSAQGALADSALQSETDPVFTASVASGITSTNISNWNTAYGWGDHSTQGYLTTAGVDTHLNTSTATTGEVLSWNGTDYDWIAAGGGGTDTLQDITDNGATTTAKITVGGLVSNGEIEEQTYSLTGTAIDPANGTIQYKTLGANTTFTESLAEGEYVTLMIDDGTGYTVTWPTTTWVGGSAPTLETTGYNVIEIWKVNSILYGAFVGAA